MVNQTLSAAWHRGAMRGVLALFVGLAVLAAPAQAQKLPVKPPASKSATAALLRGPVDPAEAPGPASPTDKAPAASPPALPALLAPLAAAPAKPDAGRCRLTCASNYYFCLSNGGADDCPATWGQCRAACDASSPGLDPPTAPAV